MAAFTHHIFVCGNVRDPANKRGCCDPEGRQTLREAFKKELKAAGFGLIARANHSGCLEQCEHGPTVVIYPQGIWYGKVTLEDVPRIVAKTIVGGEILNDLLIADSCLNNPDCPHRGGAERSEARVPVG
jgi:(2Fe-2S) ferredoxin